MGATGIILTNGVAGVFWLERIFARLTQIVEESLGHDFPFSVV
jgi:hypothetical protein